MFQCTECLASVEMMGERLEIALTFAVDSAGRVFDPAAADGTLPRWDGPSGDDAEA